jgi:hypothetical protein
MKNLHKIKKEEILSDEVKALCWVVQKNDGWYVYKASIDSVLWFSANAKDTLYRNWNSLTKYEISQYVANWIRDGKPEPKPFRSLNEFL